jgi:hypothetical protein
MAIIGPSNLSISSWLSRQIAYLNLSNNETCLAQRGGHEALDREIVPFEQIADERSADVLTHPAGDRRVSFANRDHLSPNIVAPTCQRSSSV